MNLSLSLSFFLTYGEGPTSSKVSLHSLSSSRAPPVNLLNVVLQHPFQAVHPSGSEKDTLIQSGAIPPV